MIDSKVIKEERKNVRQSPTGKDSIVKDKGVVQQWLCLFVQFKMKPCVRKRSKTVDQRLESNTEPGLMNLRTQLEIIAQYGANPFPFSPLFISKNQILENKSVRNPNWYRICKQLANPKHSIKSRSNEARYQAYQADSRLWTEEKQQGEPKRSTLW